MTCGLVRQAIALQRAVESGGSTSLVPYLWDFTGLLLQDGLLQCITKLFYYLVTCGQGLEQRPRITSWASPDEGRPG